MPLHAVALKKVVAADGPLGLWRGAVVPHIRRNFLLNCLLTRSG